MRVVFQEICWSAGLFKVTFVFPTLDYQYIWSGIADSNYELFHIFRFSLITSLGRRCNDQRRRNDQIHEPVGHKVVVQKRFNNVLSDQIL